MKLVSTCRFPQLVIQHRKLPISKKKSSKLTEFSRQQKRRSALLVHLSFFYRASMLLLFRHGIGTSSRRFQIPLAELSNSEPFAESSGPNERNPEHSRNTTTYSVSLPLWFSSIPCSKPDDSLISTVSGFS